MSARRRPRGAAAVVACAGLALTVGATFSLSGASAATAAGSDYPSWADVQAAKADQTSKQAEITKIQGILSQLQTQADALGKIAEQKAETYNQARDALAAAASKTAQLTAQADAAQADAATSAKRAGALVAQLARTGGGDVSLGVLLGSSSHTDQLLSTLGTASRMAESTAGILRKAEFDKNSASSLAQAAASAEKKRRSLAADAAAANDAAQKAVDAAESQLTQQQAASQTMYAQLASLKNTTASVEQQYQLGVAEEARQNAVTTPPSAPIINPNPPAPIAGAVDGAIAFAKAQLGKPYALGGAGPTYWDCSGLTLMSYRAVGVSIGTHSATNQYNTLKASGRLVNLSQVLPGDLLFYTDGGGNMYHVAIALGGNQMIEAPRPGVPVRIVPIRYGDLMPYVGRPTA